MTPQESRPCTRCGGDGYLTITSTEKDCPRCNGLGKEPDSALLVLRVHMAFQHRVTNCRYRYPGDGEDCTCGRDLADQEVGNIIARAVEAARIETADWLVHVVDAVEQRTADGEDMWRTFRGIRNMMRYEFEAKYGVDPSPNYHGPAKLKGSDNQGGSSD